MKDPESLPKIEIAREKPLPFKPSGAHNNDRKGGRGRDNRRGNRSDRRRDNRDNHYEFKRTSSKNKRDFQSKDNKRPHRTSSEKKQALLFAIKGNVDQNFIKKDFVS